MLRVYDSITDLMQACASHVSVHVREAAIPLVAGVLWPACSSKYGDPSDTISVVDQVRVLGMTGYLTGFDPEHGVSIRTMLWPLAYLRHSARAGECHG
jgi:hypothetical protein